MSFKLAITKMLPDKMYLNLMFLKHFGRLINFKKPKTFNEKLQWLKIYDRNPLYTKLVDKLEVKKYVAETIGEEYVIPTLGVWKNPEDIDFDSLPDQFVLKWNHDSGSVVICKDKSKLNVEETIQKLQRGKKYNGFWYGREWPYKNVEPYVFAEQYMEDTQSEDQKKYGLVDYKFYSFNGKTKVLYVSRGLGTMHNDAEISFYNLDWTPCEFKRGDFKALSETLPKPAHFDQMVELSDRLSKIAPFLRVDFYEINHQIYFSEFTFYPCSGLMSFSPVEWDEKMGDWLELPKK